MTGKLNDKVIVITGSTRGFGLAVARACGREGARVVISSRMQDAVDGAVKELRSAGMTAEGIACDVSRLEQVETLGAFATRAFGRFDVWINNAGWAPPYGPAMHISPAMFLRTVDTNVVGTYYGSLVAMREFLPRATGKLINLLGRGSDGRMSRNQTALAASKAWVQAFTQDLAADYKDAGVGIYGINPGMMTTDFLTDLQAVSGYEERLKAMPTVIRMWAKPPEVPAEKVVWLASAATDGKTGLLVSQMNVATLAGGAVREGVRRLLRRPAPEIPVSVQTVPAALPLPNRRGPGIGPGAPDEKR